jgi:hypothetical protein
MIPVETTPGIQGRSDEGEWLRGWSHAWYVCYIICNNLCKWHSVTPSITTIKGKKSKQTCSL